MKNLFFILFLGFVNVLFASPDRQVRPAEGYELFVNAGKQGLKNASGKILIPARYEALGWSEGDFIVINNVIGYQQDQLWGLINLADEELTPAEYTRLFPSASHLYVAAKKGKISQQSFLGLINNSGKTVLPFKYTSVHVSDLRAVVSTKSGHNYLFGVVDLSNKTIIPIKYKEIGSLGSLRFSVQDFNDKTAIFSDKGKQVVGFELDSISKFKGGYAIVYEDYKRGLINTAGDLVAPVDNKAFDLSGTIPKVLSFNEWYVLNDKQEKLASFQFDYMGPFTDDIMRVEANNYQWLIDSTGNAITAVDVNYLSPVEGSYFAFKKDAKWGVMNIDGNILIDAKFDTAFISNEMIYAREIHQGQAEWSLYDFFGVKKSDQPYQEIGDKTQYYFPVKKKGFWGFIDRSGVEVIHCVYDEVGEVVDGLIVVRFHGDYGIIDKEGNWKVMPQKERLKIINGHYYLKYNLKLTQLKDYDGELIYFTENKVETFDNYMIEYLSDGAVWKIDYQGMIVNKSSHNDRYQEVRPPSEGFYPVKMDGQYGFIDAQNRLRIANRYDDVGDFSEGLAPFKLLGHWGYLNKREQIVVQPLYSYVSGFEDGLSVVGDRNGMGIINQEGKKVSSFEYDSVYRESNGRFVVIKNDKKGLINKEGRLIINAKYDELADLGNGRVVVKKFGQYGVVGLDGVDVIPIMYDELYYDPAEDHYLAMKKSKWKEVELP